MALTVCAEGRTTVVASEVAASSASAAAAAVVTMVDAVLTSILTPCYSDSVAFTLGTESAGDSPATAVDTMSVGTWPTAVICRLLVFGSHTNSPLVPKSTLSVSESATVSTTVAEARRRFRDSRRRCRAS